MKNNSKTIIICIIFIFFILLLIPETYGEFFSGRDNSSITNGNNSEVEPPAEDNINNDANESLPADAGNDNSQPNEEYIDNSILPSDKIVFLTFDDGPSRLTPKVLDILREYNVKGTFFTIGRQMELFPEIAVKTYSEGHMILPHSYSHNFAIYTTLESFYEDFYRSEEVYKKILGIDAPPIFRFPGGSSNQSSFQFGGRQFMTELTKDIKEKGYYYIDWNVDSRDTTADFNDAEKLLENVLGGIENKKFAIVLFHDLERNTKLLEILPLVIEELKAQGYTFRSFRDIAEDELDKMVKLKMANRPIIR